MKTPLLLACSGLCAVGCPLTGQVDRADPARKIRSLYDKAGELISELPYRSGVGGKYGGRRGGLKRLRGKDSNAAHAVHRALHWLKSHQHPDGRFDAARFQTLEDPRQKRSGDPGEGPSPVASTAVVLLGFLANGNTLRTGPYRDTLRLGVDWMRRQQDAEGWYARSLSDHCLATWAMVEAQGMSPSPILGPEVRKALRVLSARRLQDGGFADSAKAQGSELLATALALHTLRAGNDFKLVPGADWRPRPELWKALSDKRASLSLAVAPSLRCQHAAANADAIWLYAMFFSGHDPKRNPAMRDAAERLLKSEALASEQPIGPLLQYHGGAAMYQMGGRYWAVWRKKATKRLIQEQRGEGQATGSWDPVGPGGRIGGRLWMTAWNTLALQSWYRFTKLVR